MASRPGSRIRNPRRVSANRMLLTESTFIPTSIPNLLFWFDAADSSTITSSGSPALVSQWNDKSGGARNATQAVSASQPSTETRTINGLNALTFDGVRFLTYSAASDTIDLSPISFFAVVEFDTLSGYRRIISSRRSATGTADDQSPNMSLLYIVDNDVISFASAATYADVIINPQVGVPYVFDGFGNNNDHAGYSQWAINEGAGTTTAIANQRYFRIGRSCTNSGNPPGSVNGHIGTIGEIIVYNADLLWSQRLAVRQYLRRKWSVPNVVPVAFS